MKKITHIAVIVFIVAVLFSGCIGDKPEKNASSNNTGITPDVIATVPTEEQTPDLKDVKVKVEGKAVRDGRDYYLVVAVGNMGNKPIRFDFIEGYYFAGSFENRIGLYSFQNDSIILPGKALYFEFTTAGHLDSMKKIASNYGDNTVKFYLRMMNSSETFGEKAYMAVLPPVEDLPDRSGGLNSGHTMALLPSEKQPPGTEVDSLYVEALLYLPPNASAGVPKTKEDRDYLITVKLQNNEKSKVVFDKITTLVNEGGKGIWGNVSPESGAYWELVPGEPLYLVFSTAGYTRQAQQAARDNNKEELYFSFKLSYKEKSLYKMFITTLPFLEDLPDSDRILKVDGLPLKLEVAEIPK